MSRAIVGLAAIAAAALVIILAPRAPSPLPAYELNVTGGERTQRSGAPAAVETRETLRLAEGSAAVLELRPEVPVEEAIALFVYLHVGGQLIAWDTPSAISPEGAVRTELRVDRDRAKALRDPAELVVVLARRGDPPAAKAIEAQLRAGGERSGAWLLFRRNIALAE